MQSVHALQKKNESLAWEVNQHEHHVQNVLANGEELLKDESLENPELYAEKISGLKTKWDGLKESIEDRKKRLADSERAQQYYHDAAEAEAWMSEQVEMRMMMMMIVVVVVVVGRHPITGV